MITALDSNVLIALWDQNPDINSVSRQALDNAQKTGALVISGAVYAELLASPGRTQEMLDNFFAATAIRVDWDAGEEVWRRAGIAFQGYVNRRKRTYDMPRRIMADFLIGAHALIHGHRLMTFDQRLFKAAFPDLHVIAPDA